MLTSTLLLSGLVCLAASNPIEKRHEQAWPEPVRDYYEAANSVFDMARIAIDDLRPTSCDLSDASMPILPTSTATSLPGPAEGLGVYHVAIGRGTQVRSSTLPSLLLSTEGNRPTNMTTN